MTDEDDEKLCASRRTVQLGPMAATDLRCMRVRWMHRDGNHVAARRFGDVYMTARWPGQFEEEGESDG